MGLLKNVRLLRRNARRNDKRFVFKSLRAIRRIARQSQVLRWDFFNSLTVADFRILSQSLIAVPGYPWFSSDDLSCRTFSVSRHIHQPLDDQVEPGKVTFCSYALSRPSLKAIFRYLNGTFQTSSDPQLPLARPRALVRFLPAQGFPRLFPDLHRETYFPAYQ